VTTLIFFAILLILLHFFLLEFIRNNQISFNALMHNKILVSLCPLELERPLPGIAANVAELTGHLKYLQVVHQSESYLGLLTTFFDDIERFIIVEVTQRFLLVHPSESSLRFDVTHHRFKLIIDRFDHIFSMHKSIADQSTSHSRVDSLTLVNL
jgi:hypothetical protein